MYYKEEWVNGKLCWKGTPDGEWIPFGISQYKNKCIELQEKIKKLTFMVENGLSYEDIKNDI